MVPGFREGALQMQKGGKYTLFIPADKGYGDNPQPGSPIPPGADLVFEIELVDFMSREDFQRRLGILQQVIDRKHTSELQSLMRISYAVFCLKKKKRQTHLHLLLYTKNQ